MYPPEIEAAISACPGVDDAAVIGVPDPLYGTVAVAFVVAMQSPPSPGVLRAHLRGRLGNYNIPKRFLFVDAFPQLPVGRVSQQPLQAVRAEPMYSTRSRPPWKQLTPP